MRKNHLLFLFLLVAATARSGDFTFRLKNALSVPRHGETVAIRVPAGTDLSASRLTDEAGLPVPFESQGDTTIRFLADIPRATTRSYTLASGTPQRPDTRTTAAIKMPASRGDIAWENDLCAYRMYSATLLKNEPNTGCGVDLWVKKTDQPVVDDMYALSNYHAESQYGVDAFSVNGKRLGVGAVTHLEDGHPVCHKPHDRCDIIEQSALRSEFVVTYTGLVVDGQTYTKTVRVTTTAGSLLNRAVVRYEPTAGTGRPMRLAVCLYQHTDMASVAHTGEAYTATEGLAGWAEEHSEGSLTSTGARFYQGCYVPEGGNRTTEVIDDHLCVVVDYTPSTDLVYYFGGGWSVYPQGAYPTDEDWFDALETFKKTVDTPLAETGWEGDLPEKDAVVDIINKVNDHWQTTHPTHGDHFWNRAVYHTGNMEAYRVTQDPAYLDYSLAWAEQNQWQGARGTDPARWRYTYGESADYVLFGDNQVCFQVYTDLYRLLGGEEKIRRAREVMEHEMSTTFDGYWWWVDGFYMVMPVMTKLHAVTQNPLYLEKMHTYWLWGTERMWDADESLYYRDTTYVYPRHTTISGGKDFWARGDGWITAALPRVLDELPASDPYRDEYIDRFRLLAEALRRCQCVDDDGRGYWCRSLLEESYAPGYETSGTALITYGLLWGINHGVLSERDYGPVVQRAWRYLTEVALQPDGSVGYVQPIGSNAAPGTYMTAAMTSDFGVGAYLLAACEMSRYAVGQQAATPLRLSTARLTDCDEITLTFNATPEADDLTLPDHYLIDGAPLAGTVRYDGDRTVRLTLDRPLRYGRYTVAARGLTNAEGLAIDSTATRTVLRTVAPYPNTTIESVKAIGAQSGNPAANVLDNNPATRWSQEGTAQWIEFDLGTRESVYAVDLAWHQGNTRQNRFDIRTSADGQTWDDALTGLLSSGQTTDMERYYLPAAVEARYVRVYCNGATTSSWNSLTEARVCVVDATFSSLTLPENVYTDLLLPAATSGGTALTWRSRTPETCDHTGALRPTADAQQARLVAYTDTEERTFELTVLPRDAERCLALRYDFETDDVYTQGATRRLRDRSPHQRDAKVMGSKAAVDGTLNLTANTAATFATNGYLLLPQHLLDSLRSYTVLFEATPETLEGGPRFYDFGSGSSNSLFLRAGSLAAGYKLGGAATVLVEGPDLAVGQTQRLAVVFEAMTHTTTIYVDGQEVATSRDITGEPYELTRVAADTKNYIGRTQWWNTSSKTSNVDYRGTIDNFRLYTLALSHDEIAALFEEIQTGIAAPAAPADESLYNIQGQRLARPTAKGVYIQGGRKVVK